MGHNPLYSVVLLVLPPMVAYSSFCYLPVRAEATATGRCIMIRLQTGSVKLYIN
jgi:hypothetical protein